jgi:hypothetical protein
VVHPTSQKAGIPGAAAARRLVPTTVQPVVFLTVRIRSVHTIRVHAVQCA